MNANAQNPAQTILYQFDITNPNSTGPAAPVAPPTPTSGGGGTPVTPPPTPPPTPTPPPIVPPDVLHGFINNPRPIGGSPRTVVVTAWPTQTSTLWGIAQKFYGNGTLWPRIYEANKNTIGPNANLLRAGEVLTIP